MSTMRIVRDDGQPGTVVRRMATAGEPAQLVVAFPDGSRLLVPEAALDARPDGSHRLRGRDAVAASDEPLIIPVAVEELSVGKRQVVRGLVRVRTRVESREDVIDEPLMAERVAVDRVPVNRLVEGDPPVPRDEDGVLVIPILEEVLVVQKRLLLAEEVRVAKRRVTIRKPQRATVRREVVEVERALPPESPGSGRK